VSNPEFHQCHYCGHEWKHGEHGGHPCAENLKFQLVELQKQANKLLIDQAEWEAHNWNELDKLTYSFDGRSKMKAIRDSNYED